jgi:hypothetical protein
MNENGKKFVNSAYSDVVLYANYAQYESGDNLRFSLIDNGAAYSVSVGNSKGLNVVVPSEYRSIPVVKIVGNVYGNSVVRNVVIPEGVTEIDEYAFFLFSELRSVEIPESVTAVGRLAFGRCSSLKSVVVPEGVPFIGYRAFEDCSELTSLTLKRRASEGVTMPYGGSIFYNCPRLENIYVLADSVEEYKASAAWSKYAEIIKAIQE